MTDPQRDEHPATDTPPVAPPAPWAPPGAAPFGVPAAPAATPHGGPADGDRTRGYALPPGYAPPPGFAPPAGSAPSPAYGPAVAGTPAAASGYPPVGAAYATPRRSRTLGVVSLVLALLAAVGASMFAALASFNIGLGTGREIAMRALDADFDWSILTPVRDWVLLGEVSFWAGTVLGITALVLGIVAIATRRGRGAGIAAVVIAALGPLVFGGIVQGFLTAGFTAGSGVGG